MLEKEEDACSGSKIRLDVVLCRQRKESLIGTKGFRLTRGHLPNGVKVFMLTIILNS